MSILQAIILGLVQGLTEFIPVSSSGHLVIMHELFGITESGLAFDVALHIGTLLALVMFFSTEIRLLIGGILGRNNHKRLAWLIVAATVPAVIGGVLLADLAESSFRSVTLVAINLMLVAVLMLFAEHYAKRRFSKKTALHNVRRSQALTIGLAQAVALIPGVSRSGSTITAGIFVGLDRVAATRFSFLLAIPATFGAIAKTMLDGGIDLFTQNPSVVVVGVISALLSGLFAIRFLLQYLAKHNLAVFAYYRLVVGMVILVVLVLR